MTEKRERTMGKKPEKGAFGYLDAQRKIRLRKTALLFLVAAGIFLLGLCLNKFEKTNIFTIIAVLLVLPGVRALVSYILIFPFRSVPEEKLNRVQAVKKEADLLFTDMVFTSPDKVMFCAFVVVTSNEILCLAGREKEDVAYMERYLREEMKKRMFSYKVYVTKEEKNFLSKVEHAAPAQEVPEELVSFLRSLMA